MILEFASPFYFCTQQAESEEFITWRDQYIPEEPSPELRQPDHWRCVLPWDPSPWSGFNGRDQCSPDRPAGGKSWEFSTRSSNSNTNRASRATGHWHAEVCDHSQAAAFTSLPERPRKALGMHQCLKGRRFPLVSNKGLEQLARCPALLPSSSSDMLPSTDNTGQLWIRTLHYQRERTAQETQVSFSPRRGNSLEQPAQSFSLTCPTQCHRRQQTTRSELHH